MLYGIKIWDTVDTYYTEINVGQDLEHNVPTSVADGYNSKYQFVTHNGIGFNYKGTCSGNFSYNKGDCYDDYNFDGVYNVKYVNGFVEWLNNKKTKHIQLSEKLIIPANIIAPVRWENSNSVDDGWDIKITFDWTQAAPHYSL